MFPLSLWLSTGRNLLIFFPIFFFFPPPLTSTLASPRITAGWVVLRVSKLSRVSGCRSHHLNPSVPRSVPGSSADPGGAQEAGGPVPHLLQPRFGPEHGPRRAFCECCFLLCRGWRGRGWRGRGGAWKKPRPLKGPALTFGQRVLPVGLVGQQGVTQALPLGPCPASSQGPWLTCLVPGAAVRLSGGVGPGPVRAGCHEEFASANGEVLRRR